MTDQLPAVRDTEVVLRFNPTEHGSFASAFVDLVLHHFDEDATVAGLNTELTTAIVEAAQRIREQRDFTPTTTADIADLSRRLFTAAQVFEGIGKAFVNAGKTAKQEIAVDVAELPVERVVVPVSATENIVVTEQMKRTTTFDTTKVLAVIGDMVVEIHGSDSDVIGYDDPDIRELSQSDAIRHGYVIGLRRGARAGAGLAIDMRSKGSWLITAIEKLKLSLIREGQTSAAATLERAKTVSIEGTGSYDVKVEKAK